MGFVECADFRIATELGIEHSLAEEQARKKRNQVLAIEQKRTEDVALT